MHSDAPLCTLVLSYLAKVVEQTGAYQAPGTFSQVKHGRRRGEGGGVRANETCLVLIDTCTLLKKTFDLVAPWVINKVNGFCDLVLQES